MAYKRESYLELECEVQMEFIATFVINTRSRHQCYQSETKFAV
jgi:hypothetical protein